MKKYLYLILFSSVLSISSANATVINNGSFETGDYTGWTTEDLDDPYFQLYVGSSGLSSHPDLFSSSPTDGSFASVNGFDGDDNGLGRISISQDITVTSLSTILFDYRAGWDMLNIGANGSLARLFNVNIDSLAGLNLASYNVLTAISDTENFDTGNLLGSVDLSSFIGDTVNISFVWKIPEDSTGPGFFQLDNIRSTTSVPEPTSLALLGLGLAGFGFSRKKKKA